MPATCIWANVLSLADQRLLADESRAAFGKARNMSFWVPASRSNPQTLLEEFALGVFWFHATRLGWSRKSVARLGRAAGAEYWVQRRIARQPKAERGVNWHFDKDEDLLDDAGLTVHPLVGTVTYLSSAGAPLVVLTKPTLTVGAHEADLKPIGRSAGAAYVIQPRSGRHVAFRGCFMHGCPPELETCQGERLSLLVNVWLRHRPLGLPSFPNAPGTALRPAGCKRWAATAPHRRAARRCAAFSPSAVLAPAAAAAGGEELPVDFGPWRLSGLCLPRNLGAERGSRGAWAVHQARGKLVAALRPAMRRARRGAKASARKRRTRAN